MKEQGLRLTILQIIGLCSVSLLLIITAFAIWDYSISLFLKIGVSVGVPITIFILFPWLYLHNNPERFAQRQFARLLVFVGLTILTTGISKMLVIYTNILGEDNYLRIGAESPVIIDIIISLIGGFVVFWGYRTYNFGGVNDSKTTSTQKEKEDTSKGNQTNHKGITTDKQKDKIKYYPKGSIYSYQHSDDFFSGRITDAFPALRGLIWESNPMEIAERLKIVFKEPLSFRIKDELSGVSTPIWWLRAGMSGDIRNFSILKTSNKWRFGKTKILMGKHEYIIKRIAVYHSSAKPYLSFIYVETKADKPTGLYLKKKTKKGYSLSEITEEYALYKEHKIKREEFDDGSAMINGKPTKVSGAELRIRTLQDFNFIIAAQVSPYNSSFFDRFSTKYLDGILKEKYSPKEFFEEMYKLKKKGYN